MICDTLRSMRAKGVHPLKRMMQPPSAVFIDFAPPARSFLRPPPIPMLSFPPIPPPPLLVAKRQKILGFY